MATRLTFLIDARDGASRVMDRIGDNASRLGRRMLTASINGEAAMNRFARSTTDRMAAMERDTDIGAKAAEKLAGALKSLAPAAIPAAASLAPLAAGAGAAAVAAAAYAAALGPQMAAMKEATEAEKKYNDEVEKSGERSEAAVTAQLDYLRTLATLPPATRKAAAGLSVLKDEYKGWSDGLAEDTLGPVTKGMAIFSAVLPKTTGLVKGASSELDRMTTILAGGMQSPGLDGLNSKFTAFATGTLDKVNDGLVTLMRTTNTGKVGGSLSEFMTFAREQGPVVADTVRNVAQALIHLVTAGSEVGVSMLDIVNALSAIVAAVPPEAIAAVLQLALALKAVQLAAVGMTAARTAVAAFGTQLVAMRVAAAAAPGRLGAVTAAIGAMGRGAKLAIAGTGLGLLLIAVTELSQMGKSTPPDVDRLTTALGKLGDTGKLTGEAAKALGADYGTLKTQLNEVLNPSVAESFNNWGHTVTGGMLDTGYATERLEGTLGSLDESLANLVGSGRAELAAAALASITKGLTPEQAAKVTGGLDDYKEALSNAAFEAKLAAQAQGLFGDQAQKVQAKLDTQKASADGLRQSIQALNDVNRAGLTGMIGFEAAIDAATEAIKGNEHALSFSGDQLNLNSEKARTAASALNDLAAKTDEAAAQARQSGASWETVNGIYDRGRAALIKSADAMGLNTEDAKKLADQILATPDKTAKLKGNIEDLEGKLASAKGQLARVPDSRRASVQASIADLESKLATARGKLAAFNGASSTAYITVQTRYATPTPGPYAGKYVFGKADGGLIKGYASGGPVGYPGGGPVRGPGTSTSDSILTRLSNNEYVVKAASVARYGVAFMDALNEGRLALGSSGGSGAMAGAGLQAGRGLAAGMRSAEGDVDTAARSMAAAVESGIRTELQIASPSKKTKALAADAGKGLIVGMTGSKAKIAATAKDLAKDIWAAWAGTKSKKDSALVAMVNRDTAKLQGLATKRDTIAARIATAKKYASDLTTAARDNAKLSNLGIEEGAVTAGSISTELQQKLSKLKTFTSYVNSLAKRGLSKGLLRQVLDMGPEQGYAYASALAGASSTTLKTINATQVGLDKATSALGNAGADMLYDSGANAGKGFLAGLASQQKAIEAQMLKIAKAMDKSIRKALGIKSPSTVAAKSGGYFTQGLGVGAIKQIPFLDRAMTTVTKRMAVGRPVIGRPALAAGAGTAGGAQPITLNVTFSGVIDRIGAAKEIQKLLAELAMTTGQPIRLGVSA